MNPACTSGRHIHVAVPPRVLSHAYINADQELEVQKTSRFCHASRQAPSTRLLRSLGCDTKFFLFCKVDPCSGRKPASHARTPQGAAGRAPAVAGHDAPLVPVLYGLGRDVAQAARARVAILVHVEVQVQVAVLCEREYPAAVQG